MTAAEYAYIRRLQDQGKPYLGELAQIMRGKR